jgi:DNA-binding transcriptional MerR regulator
MIKETYTIKELEALSGIKTATIRVWEKRYNLLNPARSNSNFRIYSYENLRTLLQIAFLLNLGYKISKIAEVNAEILDELCEKEITKPSDSSKYVLELVFKIIDSDVEGFERLYDSYLEKFLHEEFIIGILEPLIEKLQKLWISRSIDLYYEEYILNRIFVKTLISAEKERKFGRAAKEILIFQSEANSNPIKLSLVYFLAAVKNYKIHYFFRPISVHSLNEMKGKLEPDIVYTEFSDSISESKLTDYCIAMEKNFPIAKNIILGSSLSEYWKKIPNNVYFIRSLDVLNKTL